MMKHFVLPILLLGTVYGASVNLEYLQSIADKVNSLQTTWKADPNQSKDWKISSYKGLLGTMEYDEPLPLRSHPLPDIEIPEEFDGRNQWVNCPGIGQIRDQGMCGSCWAVSVASAFSDRACIASNGTFALPLSDEELLSCCRTCGYGCQGGYPESAWAFLNTNGLVTGGDYQTDSGCQPYSIQPCEHITTKGNYPSCSSLPLSRTPICKRSCTNKKYELPYTEDHHKTLQGYSVKNDVREIQKDILHYGPVVATFSVYDDFFIYKSGVYRHITGSNQGLHAVRIIGWGTENGSPYWLVTNSWNTHWGEQGLFKILRGNNECGIEQRITAAVPVV